MNQPHPTVEQFLGTPYDPSEDEEPKQFELADLGPYIAQIADDVRALVELSAPIHLVERTSLANGLRIPDPEPVEYPASTPGDAPYAEVYDSLMTIQEQCADLEAKAETMAGVIADVDAALGKSTAKPALAAKAVIEAWRNPRVQTEGETGDEMSPADNGQLEMPVFPGHTQAEVEDGAPTICQECSYSAQDYVVWPCPEIKQAFAPLAADVPEPAQANTVEQPEHGAPVEEWRAYARALGYAGPEIDKANRSQIRTALGIGQVTES